MKKSRFSDSQIMAILKQAEAVTPVSTSWGNPFSLSTIDSNCPHTMGYKQIFKIHKLKCLFAVWLFIGSSGFLYPGKT